MHTQLLIPQYSAVLYLWGALYVQSGQQREEVSVKAETPAPQQPVDAGLLDQLRVVIEPIGEQLDPLLDAQVPDGALFSQQIEGVLADEVLHITGTLDYG